ncbi:aminopeptidase P family N-terminal domain-containing protein, partial [Bradyrhizobium sp. 188]|uniref:aminopeptidase P family N-terminal domain-containing protein n=1 Tax=Bradyrhizobium sp. 188 TaxID=2782656 RepID=UPI001FF89F8B
MTQPLRFPPPFPIEEFRARLAALRKVMAERRIDLLVVDQREHMVYFGGACVTASMYHAMLVPLDGEPFA